jgi:hypothetical protein
MNGIDLGSLGDLGGLLTGAESGDMMSKGTDLLKSLLGGGSLTALLGLLAKFTGLNMGMFQKLMGYLAPIVLGMIAKNIGGAITPSAVSHLFESQKSNIAAAMPAGLSLASIPSMDDVASAVKSHAPTAPTASGLPAWLLPLLGVLVLGGLLWYFFLREPAVEPAPLDLAPGAVAPSPVDAAANAADPMADATAFGKELTVFYDSAAQSLAGITDVASAEKALPVVQEMTRKLDVMKAGWDRLSEKGKAAIQTIATDGFARLKELVEKVLAISAEVSEKLKPALDQMLERLAAMAGKS